MRIICQTGEVVEVEGPLDNSRLAGLQLHRAILERASFKEATFEDCDLRSALFALSSGRSSRFLRCSVVLAGFQGADLRGASFEEGDGFASDFTGADLTGALFSGIRLEQASFCGGNLDAADLSQCKMSGALLQGAVYTPQTRWPEGFDPSTSGAILVGDQREAFSFLDADGEEPGTG